MVIFNGYVSHNQMVDLDLDMFKFFRSCRPCSSDKEIHSL